jgi:hypothetical protein
MLNFFLFSYQTFYDMDPGFDGLTRKFFFPVQLSNFHDVNPRFDWLTWFKGLTQLIQIFFSISSLVFFFHAGFFFFVFFF